MLQNVTIFCAHFWRKNVTFLLFFNIDERKRSDVLQRILKNPDKTAGFAFLKT
jgi:hypothetical protein